MRGRRYLGGGLLLGAALLVGLVAADTPTLTGPPGAYTVAAPAPVRLSYPSPTSLLLEWSDSPAPIPTPGPTPPPPPPPPPPPIPTPGPTPAQGVLHVTAVFDTAAMTPAAAQVRGSLTIVPALKALDAIWRSYEVASPDLDRLNLRATVQATGTPTLIVQAADGKLIRAVKLTTEADAVNLVRGLR